MVEQVCILGATGSIGCNSLDVIERNLDKYRVSVLTAHTNYEKLFEQCKKFKPDYAIMACEKSADALKVLVEEGNLLVKVESGKSAVERAASKPGLDIVIAAIVGAAGLLPTLTAVEKSLKVLLANKEALVMSGDLFMQAVRDNEAVLLPVDSEHNAIFQSLPQANTQGRTHLKGVNKILLTGSGGPFLTTPLNQLASKTPDEACAHPNWEMGRKISVDSATMMNKGLELIEACYLFDASLDDIDIVVHPQSIVHSMVSYSDGSVIAQMGNPDMRTPIAHTLAWPKRINAGVKPLNFYQMNDLQFKQPDFERFPCLKLAMRAIANGKNAPCTLNAANEIAVDAFLNGKLKFTEIAIVIEKTMDEIPLQPLTTIESVVANDANARECASRFVEELT